MVKLLVRMIHRVAHTAYMMVDVVARALDAVPPEQRVDNRTSVPQERSSRCLKVFMDDRTGRPSKCRLERDHDGAHDSCQT